MDPESKRSLRELIELTRENNVLLKKLHRAAMWGRVWRIFWWTLVIGSALGAYYFFQPFIESGLESYRRVFETLDQLPF